MAAGSIDSTALTLLRAFYSAAKLASTLTNPPEGTVTTHWLGVFMTGEQFCQFEKVEFAPGDSVKVT